MKSIKYLLWLTIIFSMKAQAWQWIDLWQTKNQQAARLLQQGHAVKAAQMFTNKNWKSVSHYRAGHFEQAAKQFSENKSSDAYYNTGNALAYLRKYREAIAALDKAIDLNPNNKDAITNREIIKKLLENQKQNQKQNQKKNKSESNQSDKQKQENENNSKDGKGAQNEKQSTQGQQKNGKEMIKQRETTTIKASENKTAENQRQDENGKQLLRRLPDDPGGLLRQKFMRDYERQYGAAKNEDQGENF